MKKAICILLALSLCTVSVCANESVSAAQILLKETTQTPQIPPIQTLPADSLDLPAKSAVLMELDTGTVLYAKDENAQAAPASVTKIMTLILTFEALQQGNFSLDDLVTPSAHACSMGGSQIWLKPDEQMSVQDLLKATAIASANDAAVALGELVAGTEQAFVDMMNQKAKDLDMSNTHFVNATGLDAEGHCTTALDIAKMSAYLLKTYPQVKDYSTVWMDSLRGGATQLVNTNKLVRFYDGCIGLKTGTTGKAGYCLSAAAVRNGMTLIAVVMGSETGQLRFNAARSLLDTGFAKYEIAKIPMPEYAPDSMQVGFGAVSHVGLNYSGGGSILTVKGEKNALTASVRLQEQVNAPVQKGEILGYVEIRNGETLLTQYPVTAVSQVKRLSFLDALKYLAEFTVKFS